MKNNPKNAQGSVNDILKKRKLDSLILMNTSLNKNDPNINYFLGKSFEYCVLVFRRNQKTLVIPELEYGRAKNLEKKGFSIKVVKNQNLKEIFDDLKIRGNIGLNHEAVSLKEFDELRSSSEKNSISSNKSLKKYSNPIKKTVDINQDLKSLRIIKDQEEINNIRVAAEFADDIISRLFIRLKDNKKTKEFRTEQDIANFLNIETYKSGLRTSFRPIVASARNSSNPHHDPKDVIKKGFCIIDYGVKYKGYCSDMTRTIYFGNPSSLEKRFYDLVLKANNDSIDFLRSGMKCSDIDRFCRDVLGKYSRYFIHGLGHGIGVEIHEAPKLGRKSVDILKKDMVFTIEPGIYFRNRFGIRIEDDVIILDNDLNKKNKKDILTNTTKELLCFEI